MKLRVLLLFSFVFITNLACKSSSEGSVVYPGPSSAVVSEIVTKPSQVMSQIIDSARDVLTINFDNLRGECFLVSPLSMCSPEDQRKILAFSGLVSQVFSFDLASEYPPRHTVEVSGRTFHLSDRLKSGESQFFIAYTEKSKGVYLARVLEKTGKYQYSLVIGSDFYGNRKSFPVYGELNLRLRNGKFNEVVLEEGAVQTIFSNIIDPLGSPELLKELFGLGELLSLRKETDDLFTRKGELEQIDFAASHVMYPRKRAKGEDAVKIFNKAMKDLPGFLPDFDMDKKVKKGTNQQQKEFYVYKTEFGGAEAEWIVESPLSEEGAIVYLESLKLKKPTSFGTGLYNITLKTEGKVFPITASYEIKQYPHTRFLLRKQGITIQNEKTKGGSHEKFLPYLKFYEDNKRHWKEMVDWKKVIKQKSK